MDVFQTVADLESAVPPSEPWFAYCVATRLSYVYHSNPASSFGVLPADNNIDILSTANGGNTRWIAYSYGGTYTPTPTKVTNLSGTPSAGVFQYSRTGRVVTVGGAVASVDPVTAGILTTLRVSLPYASNITASGNVSGYGWTVSWGANLATAWSPGVIVGDTASDEAEVNFIPDDGTARSLSLLFHYVIQ